MRIYYNILHILLSCENKIAIRLALENNDSVSFFYSHYTLLPITKLYVTQYVDK